MYLGFFGLASTPFSIAPDPDFLYLTEKHEEALAHLLYSTAQKGGFVMLTGEIGTGKTTLCRHFLKIVPEQYQTAFIFNPKISAAELLATVCDEFGIDLPHGTPSIKELTDRINARLLDIHAAGRNALLVIDEAQNLSLEVLEQIRLLTNLETTEHKLLQIILVGQPQLRTLLAREELRQLSQRIVARYHLEALSAPETVRYIRHRLATSGCGAEAAALIFPAAALREIYRRTQGVPRLINVLCDRSLLGAYVENTRVAGRRIVKKAAREAFGEEPPARRFRFAGWRLGAAAAGLAAAVAGGFLWHLPPPSWAGLPALAAVVGSDPAPVSAVAVPPPQAFPAGTEPAAYRALLGLWGVAGAAADAPGSEREACAAARGHGLRCLGAANRSWHQFRQFNLPAVLTLRDIDQREFHAAVASVTDDEVALLVDGQSVTMSPRQLAFFWTGKFTLLWRPPAGELADSDLTQQGFAALAKEPPSWLLALLGASRVDGVPLRARIASFQREAGIPDDGILGMQTLVMLSRSAGNVPVLRAKP